MLAVIDYGAGNLFSVQNALNYLGLSNEITHDPENLRRADGLILPGVGAFPDAMEMLNRTGLTDTIRTEARKKPFLGICLGMQLLFDKSHEYGEHAGLGLIPGEVRPLAPVLAPGAKVPHMGWNSITPMENRLFKGVGAGEYVYFVHSYRAAEFNRQWSAATCFYGGEFTCAVAKDNIFGTQFHPEKSGETGLKILRNFLMQEAGKNAD